jgi:uncharacterized protein involved in type VI secretion and phage assembly
MSGYAESSGQSSYAQDLSQPRYYGKYRGTVKINVDPLSIGRLMVEVPDVGGDDLMTWALPCFPFAGRQQGFFIAPAIDSNVWVEFEQGDTDYPIWSGCFFDPDENIPAAIDIPPGIQALVIQTAGQNMLVISDVPGPEGGILLQTSSGAMISISDAGIKLSNGQGATITMSGPTITLNDTALEVN